MAKLWQLMLLWWAWSPLCLPSSVSFIGTPEECDNAHFVPGYNLGGEGFDIVTMKRKGAYLIDTETWNLGNGTCRMYINSYRNGNKQKVPVTVVDWRTLPECSLKISSKVYDSVETFVNDSTSSVSNNWKVGLDIPVDPSVTVGLGFGGSHSREATFGIQKSKHDRYSFLRHSVYCQFYSYRLTTNPSLSHEFVSAVNSLPSYSHKTEVSYRDLIDIYGTHYITQVSLGGVIKAITSVNTCETTMKGLLITEVSDCLSAEVSLGFPGNGALRFMIADCEKKKKKLENSQSFKSAFYEHDGWVIGGNLNGDILFNGQSDPSVYSNWITSLKTTPDVVQYNLKPLHTILPLDHPASAGLKQEVEKYIKENEVLKKCSESCQIGYRSNNRDPCDCVCIPNQSIKSNCCPAGKGLAKLKVYNLYAQDLYGDVWTQTDGSVVVTYGDQNMRTSVINDNDNPYWPETFEFGTIDMHNHLMVSVYDADYYWNSDLLGQCSLELHSGYKSNGCMLDHGTLFFSYEVECAPSLGGDQCQEYIPSSMSPSLNKVFRTKNGSGKTGSRK
ncbi:hypothetical protein Q5P01_026101 [Channa striata]|uniref:Perforin-1-like n=1 Tax=Channa striata TaxID=64152 RepID=A0AA88IN63_CHASR|nr:hypothetical protein Q5P01_026101 [Channa striata]